MRVASESQLLILTHLLVSSAEHKNAVRMREPRAYFILRPKVCGPDACIQLGQVITDPRKPSQRLAEPLPLGGKLKPQRVAVEWSAYDGRVGGAPAGVFAHAVKLATTEAGAEAESGSSWGDKENWDAAILETYFFEPSEDPTYAQRTAKIPIVDGWLKEHRGEGKTVYMITGLKIAKDPDQIAGEGSKDLHQPGASLQSVFDPEGRLGTRGNAGHGSSAQTTHEDSPSDGYIFAYRLRRLKVLWRKAQSTHDQQGGKAHSKGSARVDGRPDRRVQDQDPDFEIEHVSLEQDDFGALLPAKDKKLPAVDEYDNTACVVVPVATKKRERS